MSFFEKLMTCPSKAKAIADEFPMKLRVSGLEEVGCNKRDQNAVLIIIKMRNRFNTLLNSGYTTEAIEISQKLEEVEKELEELEEALSGVPISD